MTHLRALACPSGPPAPGGPVSMACGHQSATVTTQGHPGSTDVAQEHAGGIDMVQGHAGSRSTAQGIWPGDTLLASTSKVSAPEDTHSHGSASSTFPPPPTGAGSLPAAKALPSAGGTHCTASHPAAAWLQLCSESATLQWEKGTGCHRGAVLALAQQHYRSPGGKAGGGGS